MIPFINIHSHHIDNHTDSICVTDWFTTANDERKNLKLFSAGIHPWYIDTRLTELQFKKLSEVVIQSNCIAIGECGLDHLKGPAMSLQLEIFERQIELAIQLKKPVIVHCVHAFDVLATILKKYKNKVIFIIHGFNQNEQIALQLIKLGAYLSFGAALLNSKNSKLKLIFKQIPNIHIFLENDASENTIQNVYEVAAEIKMCDVNVMKEVIFANYKLVFKDE